MKVLYKLVIVRKLKMKESIEFESLEEARYYMSLCQAQGGKDFVGAFVGDRERKIYYTAFPLRSGETPAKVLA